MHRDINTGCHTRRRNLTTVSLGRDWGSLVRTTPGLFVTGVAKGEMEILNVKYESVAENVDLRSVSIAVNFHVRKSEKIRG
jgi:hypothetical protein